MFALIACIWLLNRDSGDYLYVLITKRTSHKGLTLVMDNCVELITLLAIQVLSRQCDMQTLNHCANTSMSYEIAMHQLSLVIFIVFP